MMDEQDWQITMYHLKRRKNLKNLKNQEHEQLAWEAESL